MRRVDRAAVHVADLKLQELCEGKGWVSDPGGAHDGSQLGPVPVPECRVAQGLQHRQVPLHLLHCFR